MSQKGKSCKSSMLKIFSNPDYQSLIEKILKDQKIDSNNIEIKILPFRKVGLHSLLNFLIIKDKQLLFVVKIPRYIEGKYAYEGLKKEAKLFSGVIKFYAIDKIPALVSKYYDGEMLDSLLEKDISLLSLGLSPLLDLHNKTKSKEKTIDQDFIENHIIRPLRLIVEYYPKEIVIIEKFINEFFKNNDFMGLKYPEVLSHQEYNPYNILITKNNKPIILDWEDAKPNGLPILDIFDYLIVSLRILKISSKDTILNVYSKFKEEYCKALNINNKLFDLFFVVFSINKTHFFLEEKRREVDYAKSWLEILLNTTTKDCFENYLKKLSI